MKGMVLFVIFFVVGVASGFLINSITNEKRDNNEINIVFLGDFMIGDAYDGDISKPFEKIKLMLENKDEIIVNLETSATDLENPAFEDKAYNYKLEEPIIMELKDQGITIANLANNHILDYGSQGFQDTINYLKKSEIKFFGAGNNEDEARNGIIKEYDGTKVGYLAYFDQSNLYETYGFYADQNNEGTAQLSKENLQEDIPKTKEASNLVIVNYHLGSNYETEISEKQKDFAYFAIDQDADAVVMHSTHIIQPIEIYKGKPIIYSLGNFIFTTPGRFSSVDEIFHHGIGAEFIIENKEITSLILTPFKTNNKETDFQPEFLKKKEIEDVAELLIPSNLEYEIKENTIVILL